MDISNLIHNSSSYSIEESLDIFWTANNSITCSLPTIGVGITITITEGALNFVLQIPASWQGRTTGLLGNYNGNKSDDYIPRGRTRAVSDEESDRFIHFEFGLTCK